MKLQIIYAFTFLLMFSCKKDANEIFKEEFLKSIKEKVERELVKDSSSLESIQFVKFDTLKEWQEASLLLEYSNQKLLRLNKEQQRLIDDLDKVKNADDFRNNEIEYKKISESIRKEVDLGKSLINNKSKNYKTGNYQAVFLVRIKDQNSKSIKDDSLIMYTNKKKVIFTQKQFIEQQIKKVTPIHW